MTVTVASERLPDASFTSAVSVHPRRRERLLSLDVFRGLTIAGMLLVNSPGTWSAIYPPLRHATWHGWTPTDLIFPFFLFIVGITTELSLGARRVRGEKESAIVRQVLKRGAMIFLLGLLLSGFPFFQWGAVLGIEDPTFGQRVAYRFEHLRIMGVLQRIGLAYTVAALLTLRTTLKQQVVIAGALLLGYWLLMTLVPVPGYGMGALALGERSATLTAVIDRAVLGTNHIFAGTKTYDPEGLLSSMGAIATVMLGIFAGRWIGTTRPLIERIAGLFAVGALGMVAGLVWNWTFPINKEIWTSSYVVFSAAMACVTLATCMWLIDMHGSTWWTKPFVVFGVNPIAAFVGSGLMARLIYSIIKVDDRGKQVALQSALYESAFASWLDPRTASLLFALCFVLLWLALMWILYRRRIFLKV